MANCGTCTKMRNWFIRALRGNSVRITFKAGPPVVTQIISRSGGTLSTRTGDYAIKDIDDINRDSGRNPIKPRGRT